MRRKQRRSGYQPWPTFLAWCPEADRFDAFSSALSALVGEAGECTVYGEMNEDYSHETYSLTPAKAVELIRPLYEKRGVEVARIDFQATSGRVLDVRLDVHVDRLRDPGFALLYIGFATEAFREGFLLPPKLPRLKRGRPSSLAMEAGVAWNIAMRDSFDILVRFCTSSAAITTGCCAEGPDWRAPITAAATYHADGYPGRDLALSWMYRHDKEPIDLAAGWSIDALRERVEASPRGSSVWILDEDRLAREQVLAALGLPPKVLLEALEAATNQLHPEWETIQWDLSRLLDEIKSAIASASAEDDVEMIPVTEEHIDFIEAHTPAYVKRLDNGATVLLAHPDRTLWPLWADALRLLGIRPESSG
jgi:hypothetical protein